MKNRWILALSGLLIMSGTLSSCYEDDARPGRYRPHDRHHRHDRHDHRDHDRHHDRDWRYR